MSTPKSHSESGDQKASDASASTAPTLEDELLDLPIAEKTPTGPNIEGSPQKEKGVEVEVSANEAGVREADRDENEELVVDWDGPNDPQNPKK